MWSERSRVPIEASLFAKTVVSSLDLSRSKKWTSEGPTLTHCADIVDPLLTIADLSIFFLVFILDMQKREYLGILWSKKSYISNPAMVPPFSPNLQSAAGRHHSQSEPESEQASSSPWEKEERGGRALIQKRLCSLSLCYILHSPVRGSKRRRGGRADGTDWLFGRR